MADTFLLSEVPRGLTIGAGLWRVKMAAETVGWRTAPLRRFGTMEPDDSVPLELNSRLRRAARPWFYFNVITGGGLESRMEDRDRVQRDFDRRLLLVSECTGGPALDELPEKSRGAIRETHEWVTTFITRRVNKRGRREAICPFVEPSIQNHAMYFSIARPEEPNAMESIERELRLFARIFLALEPRENPGRIVKTLIALFPETRGPLLLETTDPKRRLKADLLEQGIMVGEFFSTCPFATTFNPQLFALRSPHPMYVLRTFIDTDWRFIEGIDRWRKIYRARFGEPPEDLVAPQPGLRERILGKLRNLIHRVGASGSRNPGVPSD